MAETKETSGMRFAFWSWMTLIAVGLLTMIAVPLGGR